MAKKKYLKHVLWNVWKIILIKPITIYKHWLLKLRKTFYEFTENIIKTFVLQRTYNRIKYLNSRPREKKRVWKELQMKIKNKEDEESYFIEHFEHENIHFFYLVFNFWYMFFIIGQVLLLILGQMMLSNFFIYIRIIFQSLSNNISNLFNEFSR